jgi:hypothetical protein
MLLVLKVPTRALMTTPVPEVLTDIADLLWQTFSPDDEGTTARLVWSPRRE